MALLVPVHFFNTGIVGSNEMTAADGTVGFSYAVKVSHACAGRSTGLWEKICSSFLEKDERHKNTIFNTFSSFWEVNYQADILKRIIMIKGTGQAAPFKFPLF